MLPLDTAVLPAEADATSFDSALMQISTWLADAASFCERGDCKRACKLYAVAGQYAQKTGYLELIQLVWAYEGHCPLPPHHRHDENDSPRRAHPVKS